MAQSQQYQEVLNRIDAAVTRIEANQGGLTPAQEDEFLTQFESIASRLEAVSPSGDTEVPEEPTI